MKHRASMQGGASILIILLMIALAAFSLLALYSARSDYKLAEKNAEWTRAYYELDTLAWKEVARLEQSLRDLPAEDFSAAGSRAAVSLGWTAASDDPLTVGKTVDRGTMHIEVTLALRPARAGMAVHTILAWRETQDGFDYGDGLDIWLGE